MHTKKQREIWNEKPTHDSDWFKTTHPPFRIFREIYFTWPTFKLVYVSCDSKNANSTPNLLIFFHQTQIKQHFMYKTRWEERKQQEKCSSFYFFKKIQHRYIRVWELKQTIHIWQPKLNVIRTRQKLEIDMINQTSIKSWSLMQTNTR